MACMTYLVGMVCMTYLVGMVCMTYLVGHGGHVPCGMAILITPVDVCRKGWWHWV